MEKKKALQWLSIFIGIELAIVILTVVIFDPFYQYHGPLSGMKSVLYDRDNQVIGSVRNFTYDTVLMGSSVAENFDSAYLDEQFHGKTVKIIRSNGSVADLLYFLNIAEEKQDIRQVFWCMDLFALEADTEITLTKENLPNYYLYTEGIWDDAPYLFNKEIILEKIPKMLYDARHDIHTGGQAYDWSADMEFSAKRAMSAYRKPALPTREERREFVKTLIEEEIVEDAKTAKEKEHRNAVNHSKKRFEAENVTVKGADDKRYEVYKNPEEIPHLTENVAMILSEIQSHPDTDYVIFFPPYSMLWWDSAFVQGKADSYFTILNYTMRKLLSCENVQLFYFQNEKEIICDLDNYMDMIHYSAEINRYMLEGITKGEKRVTKENLEEVLFSMQELYRYIITEGILEYYKA